MQSQRTKHAAGLRVVSLCATLATVLPFLLVSRAYADDVPLVTDLIATAGEGPNHLWIFSGTVDDEFPEGCTVTLGGIIDEETVQVNPDGTFRYTVLIPVGTSGIVTAQAMDQAGNTGPIEEVYVANDF